MLDTFSLKILQVTTQSSSSSSSFSSHKGNGQNVENPNYEESYSRLGYKVHVAEYCLFFLEASND